MKICVTTEKKMLGTCYDCVSMHPYVISIMLVHVKGITSNSIDDVILCETVALLIWAHKVAISITWF